MKRDKRSLLAGVALAALSLGAASGATLIIGDNYNVATTTTGFALDQGVNAGINPPTTRLTGTAAAGLRYYKYSGTKADSKHTITGNRLSISKATYFSILGLTAGSGAYDFSTALRAPAASPGLPSVYEISFSLANSTAAADGLKQCSFGLTTDPGGVTACDFGIQLNRASTADTAYTVKRAIDSLSSGTSDLNTIITNMPAGTWGTPVSFLIRVTDAGTETTTYSS
ncbi:MAG TPA: hypothetical protein VNZ22_19045, partial [Bacillota bacterium]|nr:hypothetical protein [Bacillota bacterium]